MRDIVGRATAFGMTEEQIARLIGISKPTLLAHYREELDTGHLRVIYNVATNLVRQALKDDPRSFNAAKFIMTTRAGWSEYAPQPPDRPPSDEKPGKKQLQQTAAETAAENTGWEKLVH